MSRNWLDCSDSCTSSTSNTNIYRGYWTKRYERNIIEERRYAISEAEKVKIDLERYKREFMQQLQEPPAYMRGLLGDFEGQLNHDQKKVEEPQQVFHFDPKGIVDEWPEKES